MINIKKKIVDIYGMINCVENNNNILKMKTKNSKNQQIRM